MKLASPEFGTRDYGRKPSLSLVQCSTFATE